MTLKQDLTSLTIAGQLTGVVDFDGYWLNVAELDIGGIASGGRLNVRYAGYPEVGSNDHFTIHGDMRGALDIWEIVCPFTIDGSVYGNGMHLGPCWVPCAKTSRITGAIASGAIVDMDSIEGCGVFRIDGGIDEDAHLAVQNIGWWGPGQIGTLAIDGDMAGELYVKRLQRNLQLGNVPPSGRIWIDEFRGYSAEPFRASLVVANGLAGDLAIGGKAAGPPPETANVQYARLEIGTAAPEGVTGELYFSGSLNQDVDVTIHGDLHDPEDPQSQDPQMSGGHIIILGGFGTAQGEATITIDGALTGPRPFIVVDYDGWHELHRWQASGTVIITTPDPNDPNVPPLYLYGNTPAWHVWEITECRGDMNNDGAVDFGDINPFVQALSYVRAYSLDFPGLGALEDPWDPNAGSRVYHGDCNCDGVFDFGDINPFIELVAQPQPCCSHECPCTAGGGGLMAMPEPEYLAAKLAVNVKPELFDDLVAMAAAAASVQTDPKLKTYWEKVHHTLAP